MRIFCCLLIVLFMGMTVPAVAEYYKYVDKNGVTRFTDNLADIPEDQRPKIKTFEESEYKPAYPKTIQKSPRDADQIQTEQRGAGVQKKKRGITLGSTKAEQMRQTRDELESEHASLMAEKKALEAKRDTLKTATDVRAYQNEVEMLNRKIAAFEKRREAFTKEVDAFNKEPQGE